MPKEFIFEGKTTTEATEKGLKELKVSKDKVEITVLEQEKRSFFSILTPRVVKVKMVLKEEKTPKQELKKKEERPKVEKVEASKEEIEEAKKAVEIFLTEFIATLKNKQIVPSVRLNDNSVEVILEGENASEFIGYRGEVLNAMQTILSTIANKNHKNKVKVTIDIEGYKKRREKILEELAIKVAKSVVRTGKSITLEPMTAYERKIIHSKLQENNRVETHSIGEEPRRRIVITKK